MEVCVLLVGGTGMEIERRLGAALGKFHFHAMRFLLEIIQAMRGKA